MAHLVIGAAGFTGLKLVQRLVEQGEEVVAADLEPAPAEAPQGVRWITADLCKPDSVAALPLSSDDTVYHLAARQYHRAVPRTNRDQWFAEVNVGGTGNLLQRMRSRDCRRLLYFSTDMVYGPPQTSPVTTRHPLNPAGPYGRSKKRSEELCREFREHGMAITILRPRLIVGPGRLGILEKLFALIRRGLPLPLIGSGNNRYQMVSVHDCVSAAVLAVKAGLPNREFNLGSDDPPRVKDLLRDLIERVGSRSFLVPTPASAVKATLALLDRAGLTLLYPDQFAIADAEYIVDISETRDGLGWTPQYRDAEMLADAYRIFVDRDVAGRGESSSSSRTT